MVNPFLIGIAVMGRVKTVLRKPCQLIAGSVSASNFLRLTSSKSDVAVMAGAVVAVGWPLGLTQLPPGFAAHTTKPA